MYHVKIKFNDDIISGEYYVADFDEVTIEKEKAKLFKFPNEAIDLGIEALAFWGTYNIIGFHVEVTT